MFRHIHISTLVVLAAVVALEAGARSSPMLAQCQSSEMAKLLASYGAAGDNFGCCVAMDGNTAVIGAPENDDNGTGSGSAYVFQFDGSSWLQQANLLASDAAAGDSFGSVAISCDTAVIGANAADDNGTDSGSAYVSCYDDPRGCYAPSKRTGAFLGAKRACCPQEEPWKPRHGGKRQTHGRPNGGALNNGGTRSGGVAGQGYLENLGLTYA